MESADSGVEGLSLSDLSVREELRGKSPYGAPQMTVANQLNTNENPYPPSPGLVAELVQEVEKYATVLNRYPERDAVALRERLAQYISNQTGVKVTAQNVWAANGSNEVLQQLLQAFGGPGRCALGFTPSYSMHPLLCEGTHTTFVECPRDPNFSIDVSAALEAVARYQPDVVFITTPNNPTGDVTPLAVIEKIIKATPGIVVVDEAYMEFSASPSATTLIEKYPAKVVVSRTMSKAFDFAGGRLGYFVADKAFVEAVMLVRLPYHLSTLSQIAAMVALDHEQETLATVDQLARERERVEKELKKAGYFVVPSQSNFIFFGGFEDQHLVWEEFLKREVLIRDVGQPGYLRTTIGLPAENDAFIAAAWELTDFITEVRKETS